MKDGVLENRPPDRVTCRYIHVRPSVQQCFDELTLRVDAPGYLKWSFTVRSPSPRGRRHIAPTVVQPMFSRRKPLDAEDIRTGCLERRSLLSL